MRTLTQLQQTELEALVDGASLAGVIFALVQIANEKGEHIATNWQDEATAKQWFKAANSIDRVVDAVAARGV